MGQTMCGGACVDLATNNRNCGACGTRCMANQTCQNGKCACPANTTDCGNACGSNTPEPASWALLIAGFGAVGAALRTRRAGGVQRA